MFTVRPEASSAVRVTHLGDYRVTELLGCDLMISCQGVFGSMAKMRTVCRVSGTWTSAKEEKDCWRGPQPPECCEARGQRVRSALCQLQAASYGLIALQYVLCYWINLYTKCLRFPQVCQTITPMLGIDGGSGHQDIKMAVDCPMMADLLVQGESLARLSSATCAWRYERHGCLHGKRFEEPH